MKLTQRQSRILEEVANTFIAAVDGKRTDPEFWKARGGERVKPEKIAEIVSRQPQPDREEFLQLLKILDSNLLGVSWGGPMKRFLDLSPAQREKMLQRWSTSRLAKLRKAFSTLKKLNSFLYYTAVENGEHPAYKAIGYPGPPLGKFDETSPIPVLTPGTDTILSCEILIIGSGAGGGVFAAELSAAGKDVIVLEKGPYLSGANLSQEEGKMFNSLYERMGAMTSSNGEVSLLAGSCLGGGTTVNWAGCFRTPDYILDEWATHHQAPLFADKRFQASLDEVSRVISVNSSAEGHNFQNRALWTGSQKLGHAVSLIQRNEKDVGESDLKALGFSCFGDRYGKKQGGVKTWLKQASENGARIICNCSAEKLTIKNGRATGAEATVTSPQGTTLRLFVKAEKIVVAGGAINTPALLKNSGLKHPHIGRNLHLHPTVGATGIYKEVSAPWYGPMMSVVNDQFARVSGNYGFKLETPPSHPGVIAMSLPWKSAAGFKEDLIRCAHFASFIAITRDKDCGYISVDKKGVPIVHYHLSKFDLQHVLKGLTAASRIHFENNCQSIIYPHYQNHRFENTGKKADLERFLHDLPVWGWRPNMFALYSAHQMASCRMGGDQKTHPTSPEGSLYEVPNIYIGDASAFPSASGVNPMLTIMALAHYISHALR